MKKNKKMTLKDLKDLFPEWESMPWRNNATSATRKGFVHKHNPSRKPAPGKPSEYRRLHMGKKKK